MNTYEYEQHLESLTIEEQREEYLKHFNNSSIVRLANFNRIVWSVVDGEFRGVFTPKTWILSAFYVANEMLPADYYVPRGDY